MRRRQMLAKRRQERETAQAYRPAAPSYSVRSFQIERPRNFHKVPPRRFTMAPLSSNWSKWLALALLTVALRAGPAYGQFGLLFSAAGPVNRGMGGVGVATANDAIGALFWNPAAISGLGGTQTALG